MRMRKRAHLDERIESSATCIVNDKKAIEEFCEGKKLTMEIGCGKGNFIKETAKRNPDMPHLAVELCENVAILAAEKAMAEEISNIRFCMNDVKTLDTEIADGSVKTIYLNFSDPWPKKRHEKRRLTHKGFLDMYRRWLSDDGVICFKTDNDKLFEFSLNSFCENDFILSNITFDLHNSDFQGNIMTEYEAKFHEMGKNIFRLEARKRV